MDQKSSVNFLQQQFSKAQASHFSGNLALAQKLYQEILLHSPKHVPTLHFLGILALQSGDYPQALRCISQAILLGGADDQLLNNRGLAHQAQGNVLEAKSDFEHALGINSHNPQVHYNMGLVLQELKDFPKALEHYDRAAQLDPSNPQVWNNRGNVLQELKLFELAIESYAKAIELDPNYADAYYNQGGAYRFLRNLESALHCYEKSLAIDPQSPEAWNDQGLVLQECGQNLAAMQSYERALSLNPQYVQAWSNKGTLLHDQGKYEEAIQCYEAGLKIDGGDVDTLCNKGVSLYFLHQNESAIQCFDHAISINPSLSEPWSHKATAISELGLYKEALPLFSKAIELNPAYSEARFNLALTQLKLGNFEEGWLNHEYRWGIKGHDLYRHDTIPRLLDLNAINGKHILIWCEQGLGDTLHFVRYLKQLKASGARITLELQSPVLKSLMEDSKLADRIVVRGDSIGSVDFQCPLMSLPLLFRANLNNISNCIPYIDVDENKKRFWSHKLGPKQNMRVGLVWNGGFRRDAPALWRANNARNIDFSELSEINTEACTFISLQKGEPAESILPRDVEQYWLSSNFVNVSPDICDFSDTAALIANLDLVITVCTSTAHLAGAMGKPVWVMLKHDACWRWLLNRDDSPWYPAAKLFRQPTAGDWRGVLERIKRELAIAANNI